VSWVARSQGYYLSPALTEGAGAQSLNVVACRLEFEPLPRLLRLHSWSRKELWTLNTDKDRIVSELLVIRYRRGDTAALEELVRLWEHRLFYYISRLVSNEEDAWDALQDTWLALVRSIGKLRGTSGLAPWLYKTARNKAIDRLRGRYNDRTVSIECDDVPEMADGPDEFAFENAELAHQALARLSLPHREALTLFFLEDLTIEEISQVLAIAPGTVKSRLHYAKKAVKAILEEEGYHDEPAR
jgi:RNA polymerase sigma-70 factor, ECF subfamily